MIIMVRPGRSLLRCGRTSLGIALSLKTLALLAGVLAWQNWLPGEPRAVQADKQTQPPPSTEPGASPPNPAPDDEPVVIRDNKLEMLAGVTMLVGTGFQGSQAASGALAQLQSGADHHLWTVGQGSKVPELTRALLAKVRDRQGIPDGTEVKNNEPSEVDAYYEALFYAYLNPPEAFADSARRDFTYAQLFNEPHKWRGEVLHVEGRLKRLRRYDVPLQLADRDIKYLYEGWIFDQAYGANPTCLLFTELPPGLEPAESMEAQVAFDGYFFKIYRYQSGDSKPGQAREAPLLIGRTLKLLSPQQANAVSATVWSKPLLVSFFALVFSTVGLAIWLTWWFRRGDRRIRTRLASSRRAVPDAFHELAPEPGSNGQPEESTWMLAHRSARDEDGQGSA
jgi:hypothetical protein